MSEQLGEATPMLEAVGGEAHIQCKASQLVSNQSITFDLARHLMAIEVEASTTSRAGKVRVSHYLYDVTCLVVARVAQQRTTSVVVGAGTDAMAHEVFLVVGMFAKSFIVP